MNQLGRGNTAEVFAYGEDKICKLFYEGFPEQAIEMEYKNAVEMNRLGILVPKCYEMIQIDHRRGIIYERIDGKEMLSMLFEDGDLEACLVKFVSLQKELLRYHSNRILSYQDFLRRLVDKKDQDLLKKIDVLPEGDHVCHGDYHPGNVLVRGDGTSVVIDFMNVCRGPWQYDVARTFFLISEGKSSKDTCESEKIKKVKREFGIHYLKTIGVLYKEIEPWVNVIEQCRKYEI